eukprot:2465169-Pleurochrysis_carterae.AAC.2
MTYCTQRTMAAVQKTTFSSNEMSGHPLSACWRGISFSFFSVWCSMNSRGRLRTELRRRGDVDGGDGALRSVSFVCDEEAGTPTIGFVSGSAVGGVAGVALSCESFLARRTSFNASTAQARP